MKYAVVLSFVTAALAGLDPRGGCHGNNCNRAVTGTRDGLLPLASRSADCSSFLATTVTPDPVTVTLTVDDEPTGAGKRDVLDVRAATVVPTAIPEYADNCVDAAEYAVACSCFGVTGTVTTAPAPTVTVTTTYDYCDDL
ncbi:hypothetical protein V8F33_010092 [Rhypophila sp. PSN 637]|uniref:Uncharacterized protein n=1 Tax=Rhypophila decipiens TaxID=261697 RepID=A0AAN6YBJ6_9PEZI|nr:hypothetical protein QBC37DRAFT_310623 [Rhypophila decipiens]